MNYTLIKWTYLITFGVFAILFFIIVVVHRNETKTDDIKLKKDKLFCMAISKNNTWLNTSTLWVMFRIFVTIVSFETFALQLYISLEEGININTIILLSTISMVCSILEYCVNPSFRAKQYRKAFDRIRSAINNYLVNKDVNALLLAINEAEAMSSDCYE